MSRVWLLSGFALLWARVLAAQALPEFHASVGAQATAHLGVACAARSDGNEEWRLTLQSQPSGVPVAVQVHTAQDRAVPLAFDCTTPGEFLVRDQSRVVLRFRPVTHPALFGILALWVRNNPLIFEETIGTPGGNSTTISRDRAQIAERVAEYRKYRNDLVRRLRVRMAELSLETQGISVEWSQLR